MSAIIKEVLSDPRNYGGSRTAGQIRYLVYHYTGNDGDKAMNNAAYFQNNVVKVSAHYFVDDTTIYRSVPDLRVAWAVGGRKYPNADKTGGGTLHGVVTNTNSISIELCDTIRNGVYQASEKTLSNGLELGRALMKKYGIPLKNVCRHFDVTGKHCPSYLIAQSKWQAFLKRLEDPMDISDLTDEQILRLVSRIQSVIGRQPVGDVLGSELAEAVALGITDGSSPGALCTRAQAAAMVKRAMGK